MNPCKRSLPGVVATLPAAPLLRPQVSIPEYRALLLLSIVTFLVLSGCGVDYDEVANLKNSGTAIVCFGDSITEGNGATRGRDYPTRLSELLGLPVVNAGRSGDTTESALRRMDRDVIALQPKLVIIELGGNDLLNKVNREETARNLDQIVGGIVAAGSMAVIVHAKFGLFSDPYADSFEEIAQRHGALLVENSLRGILGTPAKMSDQIHPNDAGYALLAERVAEVVEPLLEAAG